MKNKTDRKIWVDEKFVTEKAYDNPKFVEDIVRNVVFELKQDKRIDWFKVEVENQESIHNHNVYACIEGNNKNSQTNVSHP